MEEVGKMRKLYLLRDVLILAAFLLNNGWVMGIALVIFLVSVILQLRDDWRKHQKFDLFTIIYIVIILALFGLLAYSAYVSAAK